jgi:hypothetical protein
MRKAINDYYSYLRDLGLSPPTESPLMKIDMGFFVCGGSPAAETASIRPERISDQKAVAYAYSFCFFQKSILRGAELTSTNAFHRDEVSTALADYFPTAFFGGSSSNELTNALLAVRQKCGIDFTDGTVARAIGWMGIDNSAPDGETIAQFFYRQFLGGMVQMRTFGENRKPQDAENILRERGFAPPRPISQ